jgi:hypothetical protein
MRRPEPQAAILHQQTVQEELRLPQGEAVWRKWCSEWHAADPHLTGLRLGQLTRHVVDNLWGATDYSLSPGLRRNMMTAAKLAIRAHWPDSAKVRPAPLPIHLLHSWGLGELGCGLLLFELLPKLGPTEHIPPTSRADPGRMPIR